ncbi:MAG TPA: glycosyltransferase [Vicinamibacterales bacterium]|nr:glycosyltransferase [Vicinamibacterales bacterium]
MSERRPRVLAVLPSLFPSTIIGVAKPLLRLHQDHRIVLDLTLQYLVTRRALERADVLVLCHTIDPQYGVILDWARQLGRPLIYEIDDDLLTVPENIPGLAYLREPARRAQLIACIRQADVVRVYSPALRDKLLQYSDRVTLVSGPLDWSLMPASLPTTDDGIIKMVYATGRTQDQVGEMLVTPLRTVLDRFSTVQLTIWGPKHEGLASHPQVRSLPLIRDYDKFFARFAREGFDIGLAPLPDDEFHRGKSNNKFREYSSCGIAGVYSNTIVYNTSVQHEVTGLLVTNDDAEWTSALERLITDTMLRRGIAQRARDHARTHFNEAVTDGDWLRAIGTVCARPAAVAVPATAPAGVASAEKLVGLARFAARLGGKVGPVLREHGLGAVLQRGWAHLVGFGQLVSWELQRRRLQQRVSAQRGRS